MPYPKWGDEKRTFENKVNVKDKINTKERSIGGHRESAFAILPASPSIDDNDDVDSNSSNNNSFVPPPIREEGGGGGEEPSTISTTVNIPPVSVTTTLKKKNNNNIVPPPLPHKCIIVLIDYWMWDRDDGDSVDAGIGDRKDVGRFGSRYFVCSAIRPSSVLSKISVVGTTAADNNNIVPPPLLQINHSNN
eukprot:CAMPEP_0170996124 /NCGR_PEP_ID=MMETSP0736-20130129/12035_1 /TAXON_ID=186038 /ORGANISM="Fragilariopsis kerguelensis, Strain L26-C5" /LENGTH=190 /DNA_ID=CAMNT_0011422479 /DNA_START=537 /DNA_END=1110 /DNA_ORIENTATION=-